MQKRFAIILSLSMLLCIFALKGICVAEAGIEGADLPAYLVNAWQTGDVEYEAVAKGGGFKITGTLTQTASFVLDADGTMSSGFSLTEFSDMGILPFEAPELEFGSFDRFTYQEGKLTLLPDGPELVCEYDESARTLTLIYTGEVTVKERQTTPGVPGSPVMPGGDCGITLKVKLTPAAPGEADAKQPEADIPAELVGAWQGTGTPKNGGTSIGLTIFISADGTGEYAFDQGTYHESYPFAITNDDSRFSVDIPATSQLGSVDGTWALEDGVLKLDITSTFTGGGSYSYSITAYSQQNGEGDVLFTASFVYAGTETVEGEMDGNSFTMDWYKFALEGDGPVDYAFLVLSAAHSDSEDSMVHFHYRYGGEGFDKLTDMSTDWYPTMCENTVTAQELAEELLEEGHQD